MEKKDDRKLLLDYLCLPIIYSKLKISIILNINITIQKANVFFGRLMLPRSTSALKGQDHKLDATNCIWACIGIVRVLRMCIMINNEAKGQCLIFRKK